MYLFPLTDVELINMVVVEVEHLEDLTSKKRRNYLE
jgi:hypothetical protein